MIGIHIAQFPDFTFVSGLRYWQVGRADSLDRQKKLEARKMFEKLHRTHPSNARFVGRILATKDSPCQKDHR